jgi:hypothetical protein
MALGIAGCFTSSEGREPKLDQLYFPTGLVTSPGGTLLYVANSDFDLRYSGGTVMALNLPLIREKTSGIAARFADGASADAACGGAGLGRNPDPWLDPGPCQAFDLQQFQLGLAGQEQVATVFVGAFASGLLLAHDPNAPHARLFVPVRGDPSITYFDVDDDRGADPLAQPGQATLGCGAPAVGFCDDAFRLGQDREHSLRGVQLPADPVGIAASDDGTAIVTAHQTQQAASLLVNEWAGTPNVVYTLGDLAEGPTEVVHVPTPAFVARAREAGAALDYRPGFALTFRTAPEVDLLRFVDDSSSSPPRPFLVRALSVFVSANASSEDSRGMAIVDTERRACEAGCADDLACLVSCAEEVPLRVYMANRKPAALVIGRLETTVTVSGDPPVPTSAFDTVSFHQSVPMSFGPSRVEVGHVVGLDGQLEERIFAVCFDSRALFIFDPATDRVETIVRTGRGPHDIAFDTSPAGSAEPYSYLHVGHFTDSYIGVVDLDRRRPLTYGQIFASVGQPTPPEESK